MGCVEGQVVLTVGLPFSAIILSQVLLRFHEGGAVNWFFRNIALASLLLMIGWGWHFNWTWPEFRVLGLGPFSTWPGQLLHFVKTKIVIS